MPKYINTINDIKQFEHIHSKCSKQYVPISTSEFVNELTKTFKFIGGRQYLNCSSHHYVRLNKGDNMNVLVENSFDRTSSLRISFEVGNFVFGRIAQVHKGVPAKELSKMNEELAQYYTNAMNAIEYLKNTLVSKDVLKDIAKVAFKARNCDFRDVNINYNSKNTLDFINYIIDGNIDGDFIRTINGKSKVMRPVKSAYLKLDINNKIWKLLVAEYPELYV